MSKKIAVIFPGVGYHVDKPLLYYSKKLAAQNGYEIKEVPYGKFPKGVKGSREKMERAFFSALGQAREISIFPSMRMSSLSPKVWEQRWHPPMRGSMA